MRSYADLFSPMPDLTRQAIADFSIIQHFYTHLPEPEHNATVVPARISGLNHPQEHRRSTPVWTCHALTEAATHLSHLKLSWVAVHGFYTGVGQNHSWLEYQRNRVRYVIDVYPIGGLSGPALFDAFGMSPHNRLYMPTNGTKHENYYQPADLACMQQEGAIALQRYLQTQPR